VGPSDIFGELEALNVLKEQKRPRPKFYPRAATVRATSDMAVLKMLPKNPILTICTSSRKDVCATHDDRRHANAHHGDSKESKVRRGMKYLVIDTMERVQGYESQLGNPWRLGPAPGRCRQRFVASRVLEGFALEEYKAGRITKAELRRLLGFDTRYELDGFLKAHDVLMNYTIEDLRREVATLERLGF
jgi:hypothetical protein